MAKRKSYRYVLKQNGTVSLIILVLVLGCVKNNTKSETLSSDWKPLMIQDVRETWRANYPGHAIEVIADFNGDNVLDKATLSVKQGEATIGLVVLMNAIENGSPKTVFVEQFKKMPIQDIGIANVPLGVYRTICGKGYSKCNPSEKKSVELKNAGIDLFLFESSHILFYWDQQTEHFDKVWLSD